MGLHDVVGDSERGSITITVDTMEDILQWLDDHDDTCYPKLTEVGEDLDMRPQKINAAIEELDVDRWNTESNSNIRIVNPAAFPDKGLPEVER